MYTSESHIIHQIRLVSILLQKLFGNVLQYMFAELFLHGVVAHYRVLEVVTPHLLHKHAERYPLGRQLSSRHVLEELVYLGCLVGGV